MTTGQPEDNIAADNAGRPPTRSRRDRPAWLDTLIAIPAAVLPLLPSFSCPVCVAAYAGLLSSLGLGFLLTDRVQRPLIVAFLIVSVGSVAWTTRKHKKTGPLALVLVGSAAIVAGRLVWSQSFALYFGAACLVTGAVWNLVLKRPRRNVIPPVVLQQSECDQ